MYAVIKTAGKQYKVSEGQVLRLPTMQGEVGTNVQFGEVLHLGGDNPVLGSPVVENASVSAKIIRHGRDRKILVYKFRRRKGYEKMRGHRQGFTEVRIESISQG
jgi:large subunit ribosomal protein L21